MRKSRKPETLGGARAVSGFSTVRQASFQGRVFQNKAGYAHYEYDRLKLIAESRTHFRDTEVYSGSIGTGVDYIVGNGFALQASCPSDPSAAATLETLWKTYWRKPDIRRLVTGARFERMVMSELLLTGEAGIIKDPSGFLQLIEAEQIAHPSGARKTAEYEVRDGMRISTATGRPMLYWVAPYKTGQVDTANARTLRPEQLLFLCNLDRPSSWRALPPAQSAFPVIDRLSDVLDSEAIGWQIQSRIPLKLNTADGGAVAFNLSKEDSAKSDTDGDAAVRCLDIDPGLVFFGKKGDELTGIDRTIPGKDFSNSVRMYLRILGLPLGLPLEFILLDWSGTNYSSARAIFEQAYQRFVIWQTMLADEFLTPVIEWKIDEWYSQGLLKGRLPADLTIYWNRPTYPWIDQLKEVQAKGSMVDRGFATHAEVCKSRRLDRAELVAAHKAEIINAIQTAQEIAADPTIADYVAKHSITIPWEQFAGHKAGGEVGRPAGEYPAAGTTPEPDDGQTGQDTE